MKTYFDTHIYDDWFQIVLQIQDPKVSHFLQTLLNILKRRKNMMVVDWSTSLLVNIVEHFKEEEEDGGWPTSQ